MPGTPYVLQFRVRYSDTDQAHVEYQGKVIRPPAWLVEVVERKGLRDYLKTNIFRPALRMKECRVANVE